ncbi:REP-associated tyrosine transposase [Salinimicrobium sediminilitoris]|uniref:REP-associated tyrosine transposase n=1 Tax=Salinimicrobium sediminilitoris TaxID=2876715 RepID=UPI001E403B4A|nr:transposase [Salinimicrobium sediminilitoris]
MKAGYIIKDQSRPHFLTATVVDWVDIFSRQIYRDCILDSLTYCVQNKGMVVYGYVIMTNHIHLIIKSEKGELSNLLRDFKKFTATKILEHLQNCGESRREWILERLALTTLTHSRNKNYQVWKYGNHPEEIYSSKFLWSKLDYIHLNPVRAGFVSRASHYTYSSASNYVNGKGIFEHVTLADNHVSNLVMHQRIRDKYY